MNFNLFCRILIINILILISSKGMILGQELMEKQRVRPLRCGHSLLIEQLQKDSVAYKQYQELRQRRNGGIAYKKDIDDLRESPALDIIRIPVVFHVMHRPEDTVVNLIFRMNKFKPRCWR